MPDMQDSGVDNNFPVRYKPLQGKLNLELYPACLICRIIIFSLRCKIIPSWV
jgi:hypothetical protein